jgi:dCMP deaminase
MVIHAGLNAVLDTGSRPRDGTLYVVGKPVCSKCAGSIIQRGVRRIIAEQPENNNTTWNRLGKQAL